MIIYYNDNNKVLIKCKPLDLPELGAMFRKKRKKKKNKLIHPWTVHHQIQLTSHTHMRAHIHTHTCTHTHTQSKSNEIIDRKRCSIWISPPGKFGLLSPRKASCDEVALPGRQGILGVFNVSVIHRTQTWTTGSLIWAQMLMHATAHSGVRTL